MTEATETARAYYDAIDAGDYDRFADLLAPGVVHERPDRTIEGRDTLVGFMRDDRPNEDTSHEVRTVFAASDGVAVEGRLLDADGAPMFAFVDSFDVEDRPDESEADAGRDGGRPSIARIRTYTR
ncbi:nuclear transport factor 2 family protein [Halorussus gelatinilyticus]|uniref:Nuclear transport factor 2 family protein n=1 Tax=Halorussus gelatinilyticus TaxID=2937524 RepID=A0A8U0ILA6_9EURY|nr:nuclear transport factor 2 family protein [Halorussus gelatinilyticus]UPW01435.1 nuclear transport factor 2 family protein [Halorussus gelatinilyticus]